MTAAEWMVLEQPETGQGPAAATAMKNVDELQGRPDLEVTGDGHGPG